MTLYYMVELDHLMDFAKMHFVTKKSEFSPFLPFWLEKYKLIKYLCNNVFYNNLTFKIHRLQNYNFDNFQRHPVFTNTLIARKTTI